MTHVGTFKASSTYPNQRVIFDNEIFTIEGSGVVDVRHLADFDSKGELEWASADMRDWAYQRINAESVATVSSTPQVIQPTKKPLYKKWWVIVLAVLLALLFMCVTCSMLGMLGDSEPTSSSRISESGEPKETAQEPDEPAEKTLEEPVEEPEEPKEVEPKPEEPTEPEEVGYGIGDTVTVGKFEYVVNSVSAVKEIGEAPFNETTDGEFLLINVTIKNNDSEGRVMDSSMFSLMDSQSNEYDVNPSAFMYLDDSDSLFLENVNPGLTRTGSVVFEVPEGLTGLSLEVDSGVMFAAGETAVIRLDR